MGADAGLAPAGTEDRALPIEIRDNIIINRNCNKFLHDNSLIKFDDFFNLPADAVIKRVRDERETRRVILRENGAQKTFYLKRTTYRPIMEFLRSIIKWTRQFNDAAREFRMYRAFRDAGLPTAAPVAAGKRGSIFRVETFCLTAAIGNTAKLEDYLPENFAPPLDGNKIGEKHALMRNLGKLAAMMHGAGFNHRDFYICHVHRFEDGKLAILDLSRAGYFPAGVPERWIVKDLAALDSWPLPPGVLHATDRMRCFKAYLGRNGKLNARDRIFLAKILKRAASLRVRGEKSRRRDALFVAREAARAK